MHIASLSTIINFWLVVSTHLKNISQMGNLPQIMVKIKDIWNHHLDLHVKRKQRGQKFGKEAPSRQTRRFCGPNGGVEVCLWLFAGHRSAMDCSNWLDKMPSPVPLHPTWPSSWRHRTRSEGSQERKCDNYYYVVLQLQQQAWLVSSTLWWMGNVWGGGSFTTQNSTQHPWNPLECPSPTKNGIGVSADFR